MATTSNRSRLFSSSSTKPIELCKIRCHKTFCCTSSLSLVFFPSSNVIINEHYCSTVAEKKHVDSRKKSRSHRKKEMSVMLEKKDVIGVITVISYIDFMCFVSEDCGGRRNKNVGKD